MHAEIVSRIHGKHYACLVGVCKLKTGPQTQLAKVIMPQPTAIVVYQFLLMNYPKKESSDALDVLVIEGRQSSVFVKSD